MSSQQPLLEKTYYYNILAIAMDNLNKYEKIRVKYDKNSSMCVCWSQNNSAEENLDEDDYEEYDKFKKQLKRKIPGGTNIEPTLRGKYLKQIQDLNKFILTSSSTEYPYYNGHQKVYLSFYTLPEIASELATYISKVDDTYQYYIYNDKTKQIIYKVNVRYSLVGDDVEFYIKGKMIHDYAGDYGIEYNNFIKNELVYMTVEDITIGRRTLYEMISKYFASR